MSWYEQVLTNEQVHANVLMVRANAPVEYVLNYRPRHVAHCHSKELYVRRVKNLLQLLCLFWFVPRLALGADWRKRKQKLLMFLEWLCALVSS